MILPHAVSNMTELACYGFVTCFDLKSDTCKACDKVKSCQEVTYKSLRSLDTELGEVKKILRQHERWAKALGNQVSSNTPLREHFQTERENKRVEGLSKLASTIARAALFNYVDLPTLKSSEVVNIQPAYLQVMAAMYTTGRVNTGQLRENLKTALDWQESTAKSYASAFVEVLVHWKLVSKIKRGEYVTK